VLDEFFWLNKDDPCVSLRRTTKKCGNDGETNGQFTLSSKAMKELIKLMMSNEDKLNDLRINQVFGKEFFASNF
jgi:oleate hydratase